MTDVFNGYEAGEILKAKATLTNYIINNNALRVPSAYELNDIVIAGGFFASFLNKEPYNDIDVFILNRNLQKYAHLIYMNDPDPSGAVWSVRNDAGPYLNNPHIESVALNKDTKVQYILTNFKDRKELLADFDFVHCTTSYVPADDKLYITREAYDCIMKKELKHNKPGRIPAKWRQAKFLDRGWNYKLENNDYYKDHIKPGIDQIVDNAIKDMLDRHGNPDAVLAYQNR